MKVTLKQAMETLEDMLYNADEDTPSEYRTKHFRSAMDDGFELIKKYVKELP